MTNQSQSVIDARNITYQVEENVLLDHVTFSIPRGAYVGLIGPNGGGKTTLIKVLLGLVPRSSGDLLVLGQAPDELAVRRRIGYVPQRAGITDARFPATVEEVVRSGMLEGREHRRAVREAMAVAGIEHLAQRLISNLSGGERQRAFIARALVARPEILFLDEPTAGVDAAAETKFYEFLRTLHRGGKLTIVLVSHDLDVVTSEATQILYLHKKLLFSGSPKEFEASQIATTAAHRHIIDHAHV